MSKALAVVEKAHSELGASVAARWMACPGSVALVRTVPKPPDTEHTKAGTAAHALAELALTKAQEPHLWVGATIEGVEVDEEMADAVKIYVDHCRALAERCTRVWIEHRFNLNDLNPPGPMYGTADFVGYNAAEKRLYVADLKFGQGVVVEAVGNKQLRYYALGAALSPAIAGLEIEDVRMFIVQPRALHKDGLIRHDTMPLAQLIDFTQDLMESAARTQDPDAPLAVGRHCTFCPAIAVCPAQRAHAEQTALVEFADLPEQALRAPEQIPLEELLALVPKFDVIEKWMGSVRGYLQSRLERGEEVPGFKLVWKRPTRRWRDEQEAVQVLQAMGEEEQDLFEPRQLRSPAQIEKLVGKKNFPKDLVVSESSGLKMVPESAPGEAVSLIRGEEFHDALPSGSAN